MAQGPVERPQIAVIIGAFSRVEFVQHAVASVLGQTLDRASIEILVLKGFSDPALEAYLKSQSIPFMDDKEPRIGRWLLKGIRATSAPLVTILNDDDEFDPGRLQRAVEVFREKPQVGYYHNRLHLVDVDSNAVPASEWDVSVRDPALDSGPIEIPADQKAASGPKLRSMYPAMNASAIVVRREVIEADAEGFAETHQDDEALFQAGILSKFGLYLDDRRLTRYRDHLANVTRTNANLIEIIASLGRIAARYEANGWTGYARWMIELQRDRQWELRARLVEGPITTGASRGKVFSAGLSYFGFLLKNPGWLLRGRGSWGLVGYTVMYVVAPKSTQERLRKSQYDRTPPHLRG
jgi:glycosyltransferase involved in cell wall biosynthesis